MSIHAEPVPGYRDIKLRFKPNTYPRPLDPDVPRMYFVGLFVGSRGSGKTFSIVQLLKHYERAGIVDAKTGEKMAQRIILFSPTHGANPVFNCLKHLDDVDVVANYSDPKLLTAVADVKRERDESVEYQRVLAIYRKFLRAKRVDELEPLELMELERHGFDPPPKPKYPDGCVTFMILDDLVGSTAFKAVGKSALTNLVLKNRHLGINMLIATQNLKAVPKGIRTNTSVFVIFRFASKKIILEDLYQEISNCLTLEQFDTMFEFATREDHDALIIDFTQPKDMRFKQNWGTVLRLGAA